VLARAEQMQAARIGQQQVKETEREQALGK
jgi:hypothetical protein